ncbi:hypothetical protein Sjap_008079 [Stephania japonica]|uniref:Uncharacterized protein n=1 Tax=Stephania japonica TaxID=461633 RepID=A0AAP0PE94_9MAGN
MPCPSRTIGSDTTCWGSIQACAARAQEKRQYCVLDADGSFNNWKTCRDSMEE